ncbi:MAG: hypothetical protein ACLFR7_07820 [Opitutales bacterium]
MPARYIPTLDAVAQAARELPEPSTWRSDTYQVPLANERLIEFRKVKFKRRDGGSVQKWVHDGKVQVN